MSKKNSNNSQHSQSPDGKINSDDSKKLQVHRAQVFKQARKFIYPLGHSKRNILINSAIVLLLGLLIMAGFVYVQVYVYKAENEFIYRVSQLVPMPIGQVDNNTITYNDYAFELRSSKHFLETQKNVDFETTEGERQLADFRQLSMQKAINIQLVENVAESEGIEVTQDEVDERISSFKSQASSFNLEGQVDEDDTNDRFIQILKQYYGWDERDLKRVVKSQILQQKVLPILDEESHKKAEQAINQINDGNKKFADLIELSEDEASRENDGFIGLLDDETVLVSNDFDSKLADLEPNSPQIVTSEFGFHIVEIRIKEKQSQVFNIFFAYRDSDEILSEAREGVDIELYQGYEELLNVSN